MKFINLFQTHPFHSKKEIYAQEKACEVLGDEIIKLEVCNEEVIETIYEKNSEEN